MKKRPIPQFVAVIAVSGCVSSGNPRGPEGSPVWWRSANQELRMDYVTRRCAGYGFASGTPEQAQCAANEYHAVNARTEAAFGRFQGSLGNLQAQLAQSQAALSGL
jgi:hypothetical protein